ncbi:MAG: hypothetical protein QOI54_148 [Actinomycetota bacterium]|jgi:hypothetical protein|nr:hypothetical protein [Actinomycetota bacterium]
METIQGKRVRLLDTWAIPGAVIDLWEWPDLAPGAILRTGTIVTVRTGQEIAAEPFHGWAGTTGYAVVTEPASDPLERLQEAVRQAHRRHEYRHADAQFIQVTD